MTKSKKKRFAIITAATIACTASAVTAILFRDKSEKSTQNYSKVLDTESQNTRAEKDVAPESEGEEILSEAQTDKETNDQSTASETKEKPTTAEESTKRAPQITEENRNTNQQQEKNGSAEQEKNDTGESDTRPETMTDIETNSVQATDSANDEKKTTEQETEQERIRELARSYTGASITAGDPNKGGYPYSEKCPEMKGAFADQWGMYICESVSYVAWRVYDTYGYMPYWGGRGNAKQWPANARAAGYEVSNIPKVGSAGISMSGAYGHAVWVEAISGNRVYISQYNIRNAATENKAGEYSEQWVDKSMFEYIYFR